MLEGSNSLGLSDLMDQNLTCYEYVSGLPRHIRDNLEKQDFGSLEDIQTYVAEVYGHGREPGRKASKTPREEWS